VAFIRKFFDIGGDEKNKALLPNGRGRKKTIKELKGKGGGMKR